MNEINEKRAQADVVEDEIFFSADLIIKILNSSDSKGEIESLLDGKSEDSINTIYSEYLRAHCFCFNKVFEPLMVSTSKFKYYYHQAIEKNLMAFKQPERFCFVKDNYDFALLDLIGKYFRNYPLDKEFEKFVAEQCRKYFIKAIRTNRAFLENDRFDFYTQNVDLKIPIEHLEIWKFLKEKEFELWGVVKESFETFIIENKKLPTCIEQFCSAMAEIVLWMERKRWDNQDDNLPALQECYNLFVEKYCRDCRVTTLKFDERGAEEELIRQWGTIIEKKNSVVANKLFEAIFSWVDFKNSVLDPYCYDMTFKPEKVKSGSLYLSKSPLFYYSRKLDRYRYDINRDYYLNIGMEASDQHKNQIVNKDEMNLTALDRMFSTQLLLEDLCLDKITRNGVDAIISRAFNPLIGLSTNRLYRYEKPLELLKQHGVKTWEEAYARCLFENAKQDIIVFPFNIYSKKIFFQQIEEVGFPEETIGVMTQLLDFFCFKIKFEGRFDESKRLNKRAYDVISKPFLEIGKDIYFTPTMFLANSDWFYGSAEKIIELVNCKGYAQERKESSDKLEDFLAELFNEHKQKGWSAACPRDDSKRNEGDVDIIVEDNETALLIQLKRSKFRTTQSDQYLEIENVDNKAAFQINKYTYKGKKKNVVRWYVTNSYENCLRVYNSGKTSCTKVNYFDLIHLLNREWTTLDELINFVINDSYLKELGIIIPQEQPYKTYKLLLKTGDVVSYEKLNGILDKSVDIDECLRIADELSHSIPDDYRVWDILADIYTDKRDFGKALACRWKALRITHYDPLLLHKYLMTLRKQRESHPLILPQSEVERKVTNTLMDRYWCLGVEI